uniref:Uncharacterized protein n=1 Tax=Avena sativa TaxID=4498 RepID=A0ACD5VUY8_AVESA
MAASQSPIVRVPSRCTPETAKATVTFEVIGYSLHKGLGRGKHLRSAAFSIGGYEWCIRYYPDGTKNVGSEGYVSVFLMRLTKDAEVRASYTLKLVNSVRGRSVMLLPSRTLRVFNSSTRYWGSRTFMKRTVEQESMYLRDDRLLIECDLEVIKETLAVQLPPSNLSDNLAKLLVEKEPTSLQCSRGSFFCT